MCVCVCELHVVHVPVSTTAAHSSFSPSGEIWVTLLRKWFDWRLCLNKMTVWSLLIICRLGYTMRLQQQSYLVLPLVPVCEVLHSSRHCDGGGFFSFARILGRLFERSFPACVCVCVCVRVCVLFQVESSSSARIPLFTPGSVHSGSASWDDCGWMFPVELRMSSFPDRSPHYAWTAA